MEWISVDIEPSAEEESHTAGRVWEEGWLYYDVWFDINHGWSIEGDPYDKILHPKFQWLSQKVTN